MNPFLQTAVKVAIDVNNATSSFIQAVANYIVGGILFVLIFYLLLKKFLKTSV